MTLPKAKSESSLHPIRNAKTKTEFDFSPVDEVIAEHLDRTFPAAQIEILVRGAIVYRRAYGYLDPETKKLPATSETRFDLASVSKLFTVAAFMTLVEQGHIGLDQSVLDILPEFSGPRPIKPYPDPLQPGTFVEVVPPTTITVDASLVTFRHLLAHNSGLPAWLPLWQIPRREKRREGALHTPFAYSMGAKNVYSDIGLILVGFAMEKVAARTLDQIVYERILTPLALDSVGYGPIPSDQAAPTEFYVHQNRRMCGEVHDENAWSLGGVAGHAGLFGAAPDIARLGEMFRRGGEPVLKPETVAEMTQLQAQDGWVRRGLGFGLWSPDPTASGNPLGEKAYGHTGFTGTSLWVDPARELVIACLSNRVYYGRSHPDGIVEFRVALHRAVCAVVDP